jgi:hypothetical protein
MVQFVAFEPEVEVLGTVLMSLIEGTQERIIPVFEKHGITNVRPDHWYPKQAMLDAMQEFGQTVDLVSIGRGIPNLAQWPPEIDTVYKAFEALDQAYHMNHRGGEIGHYHVDFVGDQAVDVVAQNPYPCDFDYGLLFGLAQRYLYKGANLKVIHDNTAPCRQKNGDSCTYHITW